MWVENLLCFVKCMYKWHVGPSTCRERLGWYSTGKLVQGESNRWLMAACFPSIDCINARN